MLELSTKPFIHQETPFDFPYLGKTDIRTPTQKLLANNKPVATVDGFELDDL